MGHDIIFPYLVDDDVRQVGQDAAIFLGSGKDRGVQHVRIRQDDVGFLHDLSSLCSNESTSMISC